LCCAHACGYGLPHGSYVALKFRDLTSGTFSLMLCSFLSLSQTPKQAERKTNNVNHEGCQEGGRTTATTNVLNKLMLNSFEMTVRIFPKLHRNIKIIFLGIKNW
jgi:hypothetical protein